MTKCDNCWLRDSDKCDPTDCFDIDPVEPDQAEADFAYDYFSRTEHLYN